jgi:chaperonin cofactor prefoldin
MTLRMVTCLLLSGTLALPAELPVKQVVLYKHGVGFFERSGHLGAGESARLDFKTEEMNDVLKSLTIEERGGGKITGLRYDSMDPLGHRLAEFPFQIGDGGMPGMLNQLKGARIELKFGNETVTGTIVSARTIPGSDKSPERDQLNLMLDSGEFRTVDLGAASAVRFTDPKVQQQFKDYLAALAASRSKDKRSVYIDSTDARERDVIASYVVPAPVWKSSYRLILAEKAAVLEGWAMVDNTTGEDWTKVGLSLVSGRPISFVSQLYMPKYVARPEAELPDDNAARPVVHTGAIGGIVSGNRAGIGGQQGQQGAESARMDQFAAMQAAPKSAPPAPPPPMRAVAPSSIVADASARELGELFEYRVAQPVTIKQGESAMLPFLQQPIGARKLLIYSDHSSQHPTNAAEINNNTGKTLDGGPITVYDAGAYGGEALMETVKAGDKRLISYAVDLGTRITEAFGSKAAITREVHLRRGVLTAKMAAEETRTYTIQNVDQKAKTLIVEHPLRPMYTLISPKASEKTATNYRFEIALAPGASQELVVNEERVFDQTYSVVNLTPDFLASFVSNKSVSDTARRQLERVADQKRQIVENDSALADVEKQMAGLNADEERIRRNIGSLNSVSGQQQQVQTYARQLDAAEQQLATLRDRQAELQKKRSALQSELDRLIDGLSF